MQANKVTAKPPMRPDPKSAAGSSIGNGRRGSGGKSYAVQCAEDPTCERIVADALSIARNIKDAEDRARALRCVVSAQAELGDINGALANVRSINDAYSCSPVFCNIASAQARAGDWDGAFATFQCIDHERDRAEALSHIGEVLAEASDAQSARGIFAVLSAPNAGNVKNLDAEGVSWYAESLASIALTQADMGEGKLARDTFAAALSAARIIDDSDVDGSVRDPVLEEIALAQAKAGDISGALAVVLSMRFADSRAKAACEVFLTQAKTEDKELARDALVAALSFARNIGRTEERVWALRTVAVAQADMGDVDGADAIARSINEAGCRTVALCDVALARAKAGDAKLAQGVFASALSTAQSIHRGKPRAASLCDIALARAKAGDAKLAQDAFAAALSVARNIDDTVESSEALRNIAFRQAEARSADDALATVRYINYWSHRVSALCFIAKACAKEGNMQLARSTCAAALSDAPSDIDVRVYVPKYQVDHRVAMTRAEIGDFSDALKATMEIEEEDKRRVSGMLHVAKHLAVREKKFLGTTKKWHPWSGSGFIPLRKRTASPLKCASVVMNGHADPETIRKVEESAVAHVRKNLRADGWRIVSVESMKCGYDLHCVKPDGEMHVEVKGTRGDEPSFMLTRSEHERAQSDPKFALYLVLRALDAPRLVVFSGEELLRKFDFQIVQYKATEK